MLVYRLINFGLISECHFFPYTFIIRVSFVLTCDMVILSIKNESTVKCDENTHSKIVHGLNEFIETVNCSVIFSGL